VYHYTYQRVLHYTSTIHNTSKAHQAYMLDQPTLGIVMRGMHYTKQYHVALVERRVTTLVQMLHVSSVWSHSSSTKRYTPRHKHTYSKRKLKSRRQVDEPRIRRTNQPSSASVRYISCVVVGVQTACKPIVYIL
jgi:hypothetical protein